MVHSEKMAGLYLLYGHYFGLQHSLKDYKKPWKKLRKKLWEYTKKNLIVLALIKGTFWSLSGSFYYGASKGSKSHLSVGNIWLILSIPRIEPPHSWSKWQKVTRNKIKTNLENWLIILIPEFDKIWLRNTCRKMLCCKITNIDWS